ncbi:hypothetical protein VTK73DRAFT_4016 [Phialemonium thermophilum]|uniref:Xylanolytic transcriptional activator regulatory domain-containing protein n=1 Tax=Phialemonium thermophilum TaxID=223376 RepID=A0ABR3VCS8_9PEZI
MADHQLAKERGAVRLTSIQARLCQCFYLLSMSRINHCWTLFGTTAHLAFAIGLNRNRRADPAAGLDPVDVECRRRVFWCLYSLDNYLSAALGRPRTFHDADIDAELPSVVDDAELSSTTTSAASAAATFATTTTTNITNTTTTTTHLPLSMSTTTTLPISTTTATPRRAASSRVMLAAVAHVRLSRIVSVILRDLYPIRPLSTSARAALTEKCARDLRSWHADMAQFLDPHGVSAALLLPIYQRQRNVLNLSYWHAVILTHRPFLLSNFARLQQSGGGGGGGGSQERHRSRRQQQQQQHQQHSRQPETSVRECLQAAMHIVDTVDELVQTSQMFRAFWVSICFPPLHCGDGFCMNLSRLPALMCDMFFSFFYFLLVHILLCLLRRRRPLRLRHPGELVPGRRLPGVPGRRHQVPVPPRRPGREGVARAALLSRPGGAAP